MSDNTARDRQEQDDRNAADHFPTCPRCQDLRPPQSAYCSECGCALLPTEGDRRLLVQLRTDSEQFAFEWDRYVHSLPETP